MTVAIGELNEEIGFFPANRVKLESKTATPPPEQEEIGKQSYKHCI